MVKVVACKNVETRISYFLKDKDLDEQEKEGEWMGQGARVLGLAPISIKGQLPTPAIPVTEPDLRAVLRGYSPPSAPVESGRRLNGRYYPDGVRRCAYDVVLSADKSISVAALCLPSEHNKRALAVRGAWYKAVHNTLTFMEELANRGNGRKPDVCTHSLLAARFTHFSSRRNDPQLHTHLLVANATYDAAGPSTRRWYSLEPLRLFQQARQIDLVFQRELHRHLRLVGLNATMKVVSPTVTVAHLPVEATICERLSQGHRAIVAATAGRWERDTRTIKDCRAENIINDRLRPSKAGTLASRSETFERALSREEVQAIVRRIGDPLTFEEIELVVTPATPAKKDMDRLVFDADRLLNLAVSDAKSLTITALYAANARREVPFQEFFKHARERLPGLRAMPNGVAPIRAYMKAHDDFWHRQQDWFGLKNSQEFSIVESKPEVVVKPEAAEAAPTPPKEAVPVEIVAEGRRAAWVIESMAERKRLRAKIDRDRLAAETAAAEAARRQAAAREERERAKPVTSSDNPPTLLPSSSYTPERSSLLEYDADPSLGEPQTHRETLPTSETLPRRVERPSNPTLTPDQGVNVPLPLPPDQPVPDAQPYLLPQEPEQTPKPRGP